MLVDGVWLLGPGDESPEIRKIKKFLATKFPSYAGTLVDNDVYDQATFDVVSEMQRRYGMPVDGLIGYSTKIRMGYLVPPPVVKTKPVVIYTLNGAGVTMWQGYAADMAAELCRQNPRCYWQPIGFDSKPVPMKSGIEQGTAEFVRLLLEVHPGGQFMVISYSEGAIIAANVYDMLRDPGSPIAHRRKDLLTVCAYGNPRRQERHGFPGGIEVSGFGIVTPNLEDTEELWWDFANGDEIPGGSGEDLYATSSDADGPALNQMRAIWSVVYSGNLWPLTREIGKAMVMPWRWFGAVKAIAKASKFFGTGTRSHVSYHVSYPIVGDPRDSWRIGFDHLAEVGRSSAPSGC